MLLQAITITDPSTRGIGASISSGNIFFRAALFRRSRRVRFDHARERPAPVPSRRSDAQLRRDAEALAAEDVREPRARARLGYPE